MINVLILDDNAIKTQKITDILKLIGRCNIETASDLVSARRILKNSFDLLILDMNLPERFGEIPKENNGLTFIEELKISKRLRLPNNIIGLSEYDNIIDKYSKELKKNGIILIKFDLKGDDWQQTLNEKINYLLKSHDSNKGGGDYEFDVAIICALRNPELSSVLDLQYNWQRHRISNDTSTYFIGTIENKDGKQLNILCTFLPEMGLVSCAFTTLKVIQRFRPKFIVMTGICGGIKGGGVSLGDLVVSDSSFDLGSGKIIKNPDDSQGFEPDFRPIPLAPEIKEELIELSADSTILRSIKDSWKGNSITGELKLHIGPVGSGAAVIANSDYSDKLKAHQRKLIAIDMETYSIFYCCAHSNTPKPIAISIKGVCDYADHEKNDNIQKYCSHISAQMADYLIKNIFQYDA